MDIIWTYLQNISHPKTQRGLAFEFTGALIVLVHVVDFNALVHSYTRVALVVMRWYMNLGAESTIPHLTSVILIQQPLVLLNTGHVSQHRGWVREHILHELMHRDYSLTFTETCGFSAAVDECRQVEHGN
jgi:hypothetical protein